MSTTRSSSGHRADPMVEEHAMNLDSMGDQKRFKPASQNITSPQYYYPEENVPRLYNTSISSPQHCPDDESPRVPAVSNSVSSCINGGYYPTQYYYPEENVPGCDIGSNYNCTSPGLTPTSPKSNPCQYYSEESIPDSDTVYNYNSGYSEYTPTSPKAFPDKSVLTGSYKKRRRAQSTREWDLERRQKRRLEELQEAWREDEEHQNLKELMRAQVKEELRNLETECNDMDSLLTRLGVRSPENEARADYRRALLSFHPNRFHSSGQLRQQVEAEEKFKLISLMKQRFSGETK